MEKYYKLLNSNDNFISKYGEISSFIYEEKKSKFICFIFDINSVKEANDYIELIRKKYFDAKHIVYLYSVIENNTPSVKFSDDGEPQGTGTKMILEMINKESITNTLIIVVRYFGGILLGAGPLARAYLNSFKGAYNETSKKEILEYKKINIILDYDRFNELTKYIDEMICNENIIVLNKEFNDKVILDINVCSNYYDEIKKKLEGNIYE